jgi:hypothetical protein
VIVASVAEFGIDVVDILNEAELGPEVSFGSVSLPRV